MKIPKHPKRSAINAATVKADRKAHKSKNTSQEAQE